MSVDTANKIVNYIVNVIWLIIVSSCPIRHMQEEEQTERDRMKELQKDMEDCREADTASDFQCLDT